MSDPGRAKTILDLCDKALLLDVAERAAYLDRACRADGEIREEVERLLQAVEDSGSFMQIDESEVSPSD